MTLTNAAIRNAKPGETPTRLFDERGLYLEVSPSGGKWWRLKYRFEQKEKRISLGVYPDVSLKDARDRRDDARKLLANGVDPSVNRKAQKQIKAGQSANTFEVLGREWYAKFSGPWGDTHRDRVGRCLERDIYPWIGDRPIAEITPPELLSVVSRIAERGAVETAHRALGKCGEVFRYAIATGRAERDPSTDLREALPPTKSEHLAATTELGRLAEILRALEGYRGTQIVKSALCLAPLVFVRPGELRKALWKEIDLEAAEWSYLVIKTKTELIVPLSTQAVKILRELQPLTGRKTYVFPGARTSARPMSDNAVLAAMRSMGIGKEEMCGHGFRAVARTLLDEKLKVRPDFIEHQLAHAVKDPNGRAYNRTSFLTERKEMMQRWADYLDELKAGTLVCPG